jgi:predicted nucleotidyltransferase
MDEYARDLLAEHPEIEEVIVFGSFENDTYAPGSDLDVFIVLRDASDRPRERIARFLPDRSFTVPVDVFPFTRSEMEERRDSPLLAPCGKVSGDTADNTRDFPGAVRRVALHLKGLRQ